MIISKATLREFFKEPKTVAEAHKHFKVDCNRLLDRFTMVIAALVHKEQLIPYGDNTWVVPRGEYAPSETTSEVEVSSS